MREFIRQIPAILLGCAIGAFMGYSYVFCGYQDVKCDNITMMCSHASVEADENSDSP